MATTRAFSPPDALREVRTIAFADGEVIAVTRLPDPSVSLMFRALRGGGGDLSVLGPLNRARFKRAGGVAFTVRAVLAPHAARAVVGVPLHELADRVIAVDALWGRSGAALRDRLVGGTPEAVTRALRETVLARAPAAPRATDAMVARAAALLEAGQPVAAIAHTLDVNERTLRRAFVDRMGLAPKRYARIARFQRVLARTRGRAAVDWPRVARELGYFDQAHLVNDFRELVATTPDAFTRARPWSRMLGELPICGPAG